MNLRTALLLGAAFVIAWAAPSVFPTGTTIYDPAKAWNGYTILSTLGTQAAIVIDMNGNVVKRWEGFNSSAGGPLRIYPGGNVMGSAGANPPKQEATELQARDFAGNILWKFDHNQEIERDGKKMWSTRQHHDWQRPDFPAGYYAPGANPSVAAGTTLLLTHTNHIVDKVNPKAMLEDDRLVEVDKDGKVQWEWTVSDHIEDFKYSREARSAIANAGGGGRGGAFDWFHMNSATYLGPNHWFDEGDKRFDPRSIIVSSRESSLVAIIARDGSIAWQLGPDFTTSPELRAIRQIIGQHNAHFIPKGLPGAGNVMIFDNGGASGYGAANSNAPNGTGLFARPTSRVLEIDPVSLKLVWNYTNATFFATNISGAQRLQNGNTLVTEGPDGRIFEVNTNGDIVWEYVSPFFTTAARPTNSVYRAYRVPYDWIPQIAKPAEKAVKAPPPQDYRVAQ